MDKRLETAKKASSTKYVLCEMPADWTALPVHTGTQPLSGDSIAVYTKKLPIKNLVYEGYICPSAPEKMPMSALQPPAREERFGLKYVRLQERTKAEAEARTKIISEGYEKMPTEEGLGRMCTRLQKRTRTEAEALMNVTSERTTSPEKMLQLPPIEEHFGRTYVKLQERTGADSSSAASIRSGQDVVAEPGRQEAANQQVEAETNTYYPLPLEILDRRERLLPLLSDGQTEEFSFEPWEDTLDMDYF